MDTPTGNPATSSAPRKKLSLSHFRERVRQDKFFVPPLLMRTSPQKAMAEKQLAAHMKATTSSAGETS